MNTIIVSKYLEHDRLIRRIGSLHRIPCARRRYTRSNPRVKYWLNIQYLVVFMARDLPSFRPVTQAELRHIWSNHPECRRLVLEVERYRRVIAKVDDLYKITHQSWRDHLGGNLTALHLLQQIMTEERGRLPAVIDDEDPLP